MSFTLPELPYEKNALEPYISAETLEFPPLGQSLAAPASPDETDCLIEEYCHHSSAEDDGDQHGFLFAGRT